MNGKRLTRTSIILLCPLIIARAGFGDWFVDDDADPGGDGTEWPEAFVDLQDAFAMAGAGDTIHVAQGVYNPTSGTNRSASFELIDNVTLLGGYIGWDEPDPDKRDVDLYTTTLSGDIGTLEDPSDNSYHVVKVTSQADETTIVIDGFTITGGNANNDSPIIDAFGGGLFISEASPIVLRCIFDGNRASAGPSPSEPVVGGGGGVYVRDREDFAQLSAAPVFFNCVVKENNGGVAGGGLYNDGGDTLLVNCLFHDNVAHFEGGGLHNEFSLAVPVPQFVMVINSTITQNVATETGSTGGGIRNQIKLIVVNSILWGNEADAPTLEQEQIHGSGPTQDTFVTYTCIEGLDEFASQEGNIDDDPLFVDELLDNFRISPLSPCRDAGDTETIDDEAYDDVFDLDTDMDTAEPTPDLDLVDRVLDDDVDMGAYEVDCRCPEDLDGSGVVGFSDLLAVLHAWGPCPGCPEDLDGSGVVGFSDLLAILNAWGPCPCPGTGADDDCADYDLGENCECRDTLVDLIENGTQTQSNNARCWLEHYIDHHDANGCNCSHPTPFCSGADPCGGH